MALLILAGMSFAAFADDPEFETVHWSFSSFFGTGWYQIDENRSVFILRMPPRWVVTESSFTEETGRKLGYEVHFPVTVGFHDIDDIPGIIEPDNFGTVSFTPGLEVEIPVTEHWYLRPFVNAGYGYNKSDSVGAWIYYAGIKSRYRIESENVTWGLLSNIYYSGYEDDNNRSGNIGGILLGVEATHRWPWSQAAVDTNWSFSYTKLSEGLRFINDQVSTPATFDEVDDYFELGLAFNPSGKRFNFWLYKPYQLGLALQFSPEGDYVAIKFNSRSLFTR